MSRTSVQQQIGAMHTTRDPLLRRTKPMGTARIALWDWSANHGDDDGFTRMYELASCEPPLDCAFDDPDAME